MPAIFPLRGIRYSRAAGRLERLATPPYDVISSSAQATLYKRAPPKFIGIVYGQTRKTDRPGHDQYTRAAETFSTWLAEGILRTDPVPACYPYRQRFAPQGRSFDRWGVIATIRLGEPTIFPHEETYATPKEDRLLLMRAVDANLSPI